MGAVANKTHTLASQVNDDATFTTTYPTGATQASLRGSVGGQLVIADKIWLQGVDPGVDFLFGASTITVTNRTGAALASGSVLTLSFGQTDRNGGYNLGLGDDPGQAAAGDGSGQDIQELTASGAVNRSTRVLNLNHASVVIAATLDVANFQGLLIIRDTSASGTAAHTVTLTNGTFNGTNTVATLNAPGEELVVHFDSTGRGTVIQNTNAVGLS